MPEIRIVEADLADALHQRAVVELIDGYAREPAGGGKPLSEETRRRLIPALRERPSSLILLATAGEEAVGIAVCFEGFSTFAARPLINIHDLAVRRDWRGKGIGRRLLAEVERRAKDRGCCKVTLEVLRDNARARRLYGECGFRGDGAAGDATFFLTKTL